MKDFKIWLAENRPDVVMPEHEIPGNWFSENDLPMVVECTCCGMTMALPSAMIDDEGYIYCAGCAGED